MPVMNLVIGLVCISVQTHISVTVGLNFLIWRMMGYDVELMQIVSTFLILSGIPVAHKMSVSEKSSHAIKIHISKPT